MRLSNQGWSDRASGQLPLNWAVSTLKQYNSYVRRFQVFCISRDEPHGFPPSDSSVIAAFYCDIADGTDRPLSALKNAQAALTALYEGIGEARIMDCADLQKLFTALVKSGTRRPMERSKAMPMGPFHDLFQKWDNATLSEKALRLKTITLLALVAMLRPSDIAPRGVYYEQGSGKLVPILFTVGNVHFLPSGDVEIVFWGIKNDATRAGFEVVVPKASDANLDPVRALKDYIAKTASHRAPGGAVFLTLRSPYTALQSDAIADILKEAIGQVGLDTSVFKPKDFRPTGATHAAQNIQNPGDDDKIVKLGRWKDKTVFTDHYWHSRPPGAYTDNLLQSSF